MLEETLHKTDIESRFAVKPSFFGLRAVGKNYVAAMAIALGGLIGYTGCDEDTCETNADCSEEARCLKKCTKCVQEEFFSSDDRLRCVEWETNYRSPGEDSRSGEHCGKYHCYRSRETTTTTYTRED